MRYTKKMHVEALLRMLESSNPCKWCPAVLAAQHTGYFNHPDNTINICSFNTDPCSVCTNYVRKRSEKLQE